MTRDMTPKEKFLAAILVLRDSLPGGRELTKAALEGYWIGLRDLTDAQLGIAVERALKTCKFMPSPAEIRAFVGITLAAQVSDAWEAVRTAMDRHDYTASVDFGPLVNAVVRNLGGWRALCAKSIPDLVWARKDFERVFEAFVTKPPGSLRGEPLRGEFEGAPVRIAIAGVLPPKQIGDGRRGEIAAVVRALADAKSDLDGPAT